MSQPNRMPTLVHAPRPDQMARMSLSTPFDSSMSHRIHQKVISAMTLASSSDAGLKAWVNDIDSMLVSIRLVSRNFNSIGKKLAVLDRHQRGANAFLIRWTDLYEQYKNIISTSKENAVSIATYSQELGDVVLPFVIGETASSVQSITYSHKIAMVDQFSSQSHVFHEKAARIHHLHSTLLTDLSFFQSTLVKDPTKPHNTVDEEEVRHLLEASSILRGQMTEYHRWLSSLDIGSLQTLRAMEGLSVAFPSATPTVLTPAMVALGLKPTASEVHARAAQYHSNAFQLSMRQERLAAIFNNRSELRFLHQEIRNLAESALPTLLGQLGVFQRIWAFVHSECEQIKHWILYSKDFVRWDEELTALPPILYVYALEENTIHTSLSSALRLYASRVTVDP